MKNRNHYVDNELFTEALTNYAADYRESEAKYRKEHGNIEKFIPKEMSYYLAKSMKDIAENLAKSPSFMNYSYNQDMVGDALETCIRYGHKFNPAKNPDKIPNAFAYITQICYFSFLSRMSKEVRQQKIKTDIILKANLDFNSLKDIDDPEYIQEYKEYLQDQIIQKSDKKVKTKVSG